MRQAWLASALAAAAMLVVPVLVPATAGVPAVEANDDLQAAIDHAVDSIHANGGSAADLPAVLGDLERAAPGRPVLLRQIVLYLARSGSTETAMSAAVLLHALEFSFEEKTDAALPVLDAAAREARSVAPGVRSLFYDVLATVDRTDGGAADFTPYAALLRQSRHEVGLVTYLFDVDPAAAVRVLQDVHGTPGPRSFMPLLERIDRVQSAVAGGPGSGPADGVAGSAEDLAALAAHESWWVRRFVVSALTSDPALAGDDLRRRLVADDHPLVARAARSIPSR